MDEISPVTSEQWRQGVCVFVEEGDNGEVTVCTNRPTRTVLVKTRLYNVLSTHHFRYCDVHTLPTEEHSSVSVHPPTFIPDHLRDTAPEG